MGHKLLSKRAWTILNHYDFWKFLQNAVETYNEFSGEDILVDNFDCIYIWKMLKSIPKGGKKRHVKDCTFWNFCEMEFYRSLPDPLHIRLSLIWVYIVLYEGYFSRLKLIKSVLQSTTSEDSLSLAILSIKPDCTGSLIISQKLMLEMELFPTVTDQ